MSNKQSEARLLDNDAYNFRRPRQARGQEKFDKILQATDALIAETGTADDLSLYDIASKAEEAVGLNAVLLRKSINLRSENHKVRYRRDYR